jgi:hypothetical protein
MRRLLLVAVLLAAAACSMSRLAYLNAPPLALWYIGGYVDLSDPQKAFVKERLLQAMAWHRETELPAYRRTIESLLPKVEGKISADDARATYAQARDYYHRALERVLPDFADFLLMLDASQVADIERKFADDNRKLLKESVRGTADDRRTLRAKRFVEEFEEWTGKLSGPQREIIVNGARALADSTEERLGDRRYRQDGILHIVRDKPRREEAIAALRKLLIETEKWRRPEYTRMLRERDERLVEIVSELSSALTPEQRASVQRKLLGYVNDISAIVASSPEARGAS